MRTSVGPRVLKGTPRPTPIWAVSRLRKPLAVMCLLLLLLQLAGPAFAAPDQATPTAAPPASGTGRTGTAAATTSEEDDGMPPADTPIAQGFQTDLFTGAATATIPITVPPGLAGAAPKVVLRYRSTIVDDLKGTAVDGTPPDQAAWTGLGWTLDVGGMILRDPKGTPDNLADDAIQLVFGGAKYPLILVDANQMLYHTADETFWRIQYDAALDLWKLWTKDGTLHKFGSTRDGKAISWFSTDVHRTFTYKYCLDEVVTPRGGAVKYIHHREEVTNLNRTYDRAIYPETIRYTYQNDSLVGPAREIRFNRESRTDWTDTSATTTYAYFDAARLRDIEERVNGQLVRRYVLGYDYSIDRDPAYVWGGGAAGDLTLRSVTRYGDDDSSTLPPLTFDYDSTGRLAAVHTGLGGAVNYTYEAFTTSMGQRYRVHARTADPGQVPTIPTTFSYGSPAVGTDPAGRPEFRGHGWVRAIDAANHYTDTWFHQDDAKKGRASQVEAHESGGALFRTQAYTWTTSTPVSGVPSVVLVALTQTDDYTYDGDSTYRQVRQTFQYDAYGNPTQVQYLGEVGVSGDERTVVNEYAQNATAYIVGLPSHTTILNAAGAPVAQTWFYYDYASNPATPPTQGRLTQRCQWYSAGTNPCFQWTYDTYGNVATATDPRGSGYTTNTTYDDTYHTFPKTVTTPGTPNVPGGLVVQYTYDPRFGRVTTITDPNGTVTTKDYDHFGRLVSSVRALAGLSETRTVAYEDFGTLGNQRVTVRAAPGTADEVWGARYFDGLGRTFQIQQKAPAGNVVLRETRYDARGLVAQTSLPRFTSTPTALWTTFGYDPLARLTQTTYPDNTTVTRAYNDWALTVTDRNNHARSAVGDAYNRVVQITEPGGAVTSYGYDTLGRLTSVIDAVGNPTTMVYDTLGRKTEMTEPNMGHWTYGYDAVGNLTSQTDAKGQVVTYQYDALNRRATKTYSTLAFLPLYSATKTWVEGYTPLFRGAVCVANGGGSCVGGDVRLDAGGAAVGYLKTTGGSGTVAVYPGFCYADAGGTCTGWSVSLEGNGTPLGYLATSAPDPQSAAAPFTQSGGVLYQNLGGTTSAYLWTNPSGVGHTDHRYTTDGSLPPGYVSDGVTGYLRQYAGANTVALVRYVNAATGSHYYSTASDPPSGYTTEATLGYLETAAGQGLVRLARHYRASTGDYILTTSTTPPSGYVYQATLGYARSQSTGSGGTVTITYDTGQYAKGRRTAMTDLSGSASYTYDALGRPASVTQRTDNVEYTTGSTYNALGLVATVTYPDTDHETVTYHYDAGRVTAVDSSIGGAAAYVAGVTYEPSGQMASLTLGNGVATTYTYQPTTLRLASLATSKGGTALQTFTYSYDNVGNVTGITDALTPANSQTFIYDDRDRLTSATGAYGTETYTYDAIGNLQSKAGVLYSYRATGETCGRVMPHAATATSDGKSYQYDCNGNMLSDGERTFAWDADNKPASITRAGVGTTTFAYSGDGARMKKQGPAGTIRYAGGLEDHVTDQVQVKYIVVSGMRVATRVRGGPNAGTYFTHADHLGGLNVLTNGVGTVVQRLTYRPFGETHTNTGSVDFEKHRFTGQELDTETGLYFYHARYYNPSLGRFVSPDALVPDPGDPQSLNRYSYVRNNPLNRVDPTGYEDGIGGVGEDSRSGETSEPGQTETPGNPNNVSGDPYSGYNPDNPTYGITIDMNEKNNPSPQTGQGPTAGPGWTEAPNTTEPSPPGIGSGASASPEPSSVSPAPDPPGPAGGGGGSTSGGPGLGGGNPGVGPGSGTNPGSGPGAGGPGASPSGGGPRGGTPGAGARPSSPALSPINDDFSGNFRQNFVTTFNFFYGTIPGYSLYRLARLAGSGPVSQTIGTVRFTQVLRALAVDHQVGVANLPVANTLASLAVNSVVTGALVNGALIAGIAIGSAINAAALGFVSASVRAGTLNAGGD